MYCTGNRKAGSSMSDHVRKWDQAVGKTNFGRLCVVEGKPVRITGNRKRERMVLQYYVDGYTIQEIASLLYISIGTARKHNTNMNRKLGITVREELMLYIELFRKCDQLDKLTYSRTE